MTSYESDELVLPTEISTGDVIEDPVAHRWLNVREVRLHTTAVSGSYSFFGSGPNDRLTVEGNERVKRRKQ